MEDLTIDSCFLVLCYWILERYIWNLSTSSSLQNWIRKVSYDSHVVLRFKKKVPYRYFLCCCSLKSSFALVLWWILPNWRIHLWLSQTKLVPQLHCRRSWMGCRCYQEEKLRCIHTLYCRWSWPFSCWLNVEVYTICKDFSFNNKSETDCLFQTSSFIKLILAGLLLWFSFYWFN